jgi:LUD domain
MCQVIEQGGENLKGGIALDAATHTDLFARFQQRLSSAGGESHQVAHLAEAAAIIAAHPALGAGELVVPPHFGQHQRWGALLPLLSSKGITLREAGSPASVADAPAGLSGAELAIAETGSVLLADNTLEARVVSMLTLPEFYSSSPDQVPISVTICLLSPVPVVPLISSVRLLSVYKGQRRCASFWLQIREKRSYD